MWIDEIGGVSEGLARFYISLRWGAAVGSRTVDGGEMEEEGKEVVGVFLLGF